MKDTKYYENENGITTVIDYKFIGNGINANSIYQKIITTFSIADGIIKFKEPQTVKCFYRQ